ncbi:MAG: tetratricopeptide repeat protein [Polyangiaceae bacterium]
MGSTPDALVGRDADRRAIVELFDGGARLVSIVGLGGMGKTRIASELALELAPEYGAHGAGGVWFCDLTSAVTPMGAHSVVASLLGVALEGGDDERMARSLGRALARRKRILLVLDNFEQLAASAAITLGVWMREAPLARFLVTSRVALGIAGEHQWALPALSVPPPEAHDREAILRAEAVELFIRRARELRPELRFEEAELEAAADIVRRLDGVPLAIELAAARMSVLSASQLRARLARPLDLLVRRGDSGKHGSMRRAFGASLESLEPAARRCLESVAVFHGGFTLEAAEAVATEDVGDVLAALEALVARSLVNVTDEHGQPRFTIFETIREILNSEAQPEARQRVLAAHARYFAEAASGWASGGALGFARLTRELDNLLAAHDFLRGERSAEAAAQSFAIALAVAPVFARRGHFRLLLRLLDEALLGASRPLVSEELAAEALIHRAQAHRDLGDLGRARGDLDAALALLGAERSGLAALARARVGELVETEGRTEEARATFAEALEMLGGANDPASDARRAEILRRMAHAFRREGALDRAEEHLNRAVALYRAAGDREGLPFALYEAGVVSLFHRQYDEALTRFDEALEIVRAIGAKQAEGALLSGRALVLQERGEIDAAIAHHREAVSIFRGIGNPHREASALFYLGAAYFEKWQLSDAKQVLTQARELIETIGAPRYEALLESTLAALDALRGERAASTPSLAPPARAPEDRSPSLASLDPRRLRSTERIALAERAAGACASEASIRTTVDIMKSTIEVASGAVAHDVALARARRAATEHASDDVRFALRILERAEARRDGLAEGEPPFVVRKGARAFRLPHATSDVDLSKRVPLQRILLALAERRVSAPGETMDLYEIIAAGWPGERIAERAAHNRVHVALTTLRKLGLRDHLVSEAGGYLLRPVGAFVLE